jgi:hypothetical protein
MTAKIVKMNLGKHVLMPIKSLNSGPSGGFAPGLRPGPTMSPKEKYFSPILFF